MIFTCGTYPSTNREREGGDKREKTPKREGKKEVERNREKRMNIREGKERVREKERGMGARERKTPKREGKK